MRTGACTLVKLKITDNRWERKGGAEIPGQIGDVEGEEGKCLGDVIMETPAVALMLSEGQLFFFIIF